MVAKKLFQFILAIIVLVATTHPVQVSAAPYGEGNYSSGVYGAGETNVGAGREESGPLSGTGENYQQLLVLAVSLLVCGLCAAVIVRMLTKRSSSDKKIRK